MIKSLNMIQHKITKSHNHLYICHGRLSHVRAWVSVMRVKGGAGAEPSPPQRLGWETWELGWVRLKLLS